MKKSSKTIIGIFIVILVYIAVNEVRYFNNRSASSPRVPAKKCAIDNQKVIVVVDGIELAVPRKKIGYVSLNPVSAGNAEKIWRLERKCDIKRIENAVSVRGTRLSFSKKYDVKVLNAFDYEFKEVVPKTLDNGIIVYENKTGHKHYILPDGAVKTKEGSVRISCNTLGHFGSCKGSYFHSRGLTLSFSFTKTNDSESDFIPVAIERGQELETMILDAKNMNKKNDTRKQCAVGNDKVVLMIDNVELAVPRKDIRYVLLNPVSSKVGKSIWGLERKCDIKRIENVDIVRGYSYEYLQMSEELTEKLSKQFERLIPKKFNNGMVLYDDGEDGKYYILPKGSVKTKQHPVTVTCNPLTFCAAKYLHPSGLMLRFPFPKENSSEDDFIPVAIKKGQELEAMIVKN